jgi:hypothetical protein
VSMRRLERRRRKGDRGAALVEFALILPVLLIILFGTITAASAWNLKLAISQSLQQGGRYGATLPTSPYANLNLYLDAIAARTIGEAEGELDDGEEERTLCVAYVYPNGATTSTLDKTWRRMQGATGSPVYSAATCFADGLADSERRIQIVAHRGTTISIGLTEFPTDVDQQVVFRWEVPVGV